MTEQAYLGNKLHELKQLRNAESLKWALDDSKHKTIIHYLDETRKEVSERLGNVLGEEKRKGELK